MRTALLVASSLCFLLVGCGEGSGSAPAVTLATPSPTPSPAPTPTPTPTVAPASIAVKDLLLPRPFDGSTSFSTMSWFYPNEQATMPNGTDPIAIWIMADNSYRMAIPKTGIDALFNGVLASEIDGNFGGVLVGAPDIVAYMLRPGPQNMVMALASTSAGYFGWTILGPRPRSDGPWGVIAYGTPAPTTALPASGRGDFSLFGFGISRPAVRTMDSGLTVGGTISIDFATGAVSGDFGTLPSGIQLSQRFAFGQGTRWPGGQFSGTLTVPGVSGEATFTALLTGPAANELMVKFDAPYIDPQSGAVAHVYGVLVGKRD
ncbi:MAG: hypothetical protein J7498_03720 [Sphingobium sp.]|nr:hypothetical protein [Sphingobium sp.]